MKKWLSQLSDKQKFVAVMGVLVLLVGLGLGRWVLDMTADEEPAPTQSEQSTSQPSASTVNPSPTATSSSPSSSSSGSASSSSSPTMDQAKSARAALKSVVPKWASMDYSKVGTDESEWAAGWKDDPAASGDFSSQSQDHFVRLFRGVISLEADAKVDSLKKVEKVWQEEGQSGWRVQVERRLTAPGGLDETETLEWEFTVDQKSDGTSEVTAFAEPSTGDH